MRMFRSPHCFRRPMILLLFLVASFFVPHPLAAQEGRTYFFPRIQLGKASFYCPSFHGNRSACGTIYDEKDLVAAHPYYPFGTLLRVSNLANNRQVEVVVIDRGPSKRQQRKGGIIDVSRKAAHELGMLRQGKARVRLEVLEWGLAKSRFGG